MIEVDGVTKIFGPVVALEDVSLFVGKGEIVGLLGANGSGKTTLIRIVCSYFPPSKGRVRVAGLDVVKDSLEIHRRVGYSLEGVLLYPDLSVTDFLRFVARVKRVSASRIEETLGMCGIADLRNRRIGNLSKGYRQRVILAQALLGDPDILVLDEPTVGMDPDQVVRVRELIKTLATAKTVLLSTHSLADAYFLCDRVVILDRGRVLAVGNPQELIYRHEDQRAVLVTIDAPQGDVARRLQEIPGVISVEEKGGASGAPGSFLCKIEAAKSADAFTTLCSVVSERGWRLHQVAYEMPTLEEVYLRLVAARERGETGGRDTFTREAGRERAELSH